MPQAAGRPRAFNERPYIVADSRFTFYEKSAFLRTRIFVCDVTPIWMHGVFAEGMVTSWR